MKRTLMYERERAKGRGLSVGDSRAVRSRGCSRQTRRIPEVGKSLGQEGGIVPEINQPWSLACSVEAIKYGSLRSSILSDSCIAKWPSQPDQSLHGTPTSSMRFHDVLRYETI